MKVRVATAILTTTCIVLLALGCTKVSTQAPAGRGGGNPWTQNGTLRVAEIDEPDNLNP
ncbi:MAG: hypothetical protein JO343_09965, partial [Candidatus Eremiobacteraeota bacterium]|nr:hypothetical protein [Candidatus Eremiobacteraeota bacterium]